MSLLFHKHNVQTAVAVIVIHIFFVCCSSDMSYEEVSLSDETLDSAIRLNSDTITMDFDTFYAARDFYVYHDSVLIVINGKAKDSLSFLYFYRMDSMDLIAKYFRYGNGHGEMLSANVDLNDDVLFVNDYVKAQFAFINVDSLLYSSGNYSVLPKNHNVYGAPTVVPYKNLYITENPYCFCDEEAGIEQGVEQGISRFIVTNGKDSPLDGNDYKINPRNVAVDGRIICKPDGNAFVYASFGLSQVEFYDKDLSLLRIVDGPRRLKVNYNRITIDGNSQEQIMYDGKVPYCYLGYCCDDEFVYLAYVGDFFGGNEDLQSMPTYILKFDWNGDYVSGYKYNHYLSCISKGLEENTFYATTIDKDGLPMLLKLYMK
jgi:hypothetical protein